MYLGFFVCLTFFLYGLMTALGYEPQAFVTQLHRGNTLGILQPTLPWGTTRSVKASAASLISIVAFFYTISSF